MWQAINKSPDTNRLHKFRLLYDGVSISYASAIERWQNDAEFRVFFISILASSPFPAFFWETPAIIPDSLDHDFEFVLVNSPQLAGVETDMYTFDSYFSSTVEDDQVVIFTNLGNDATLVAPCPRSHLAAYSHLAAFSRLAPMSQQHALWQTVGNTLKHSISDNPVWVSTSGLGVYWLHIRLDSIPKYYTYTPYKSLVNHADSSRNQP